MRCTHAGTLCALERHTLRAVLVGEAERRDDAACRALRRALAPLGEPAPEAEAAAGTEADADAEAGGGSEAGAGGGGGGGVSPFSPSLSREVAAIIEAAQPVHLPPHAPLPTGIYLVCRLEPWPEP